MSVCIALRGLDDGDLRSEITENLRRERPHHHRGQIDNTNACERAEGVEQCGHGSGVDHVDRQVDQPGSQPLPQALGLRIATR